MEQTNLVVTPDGKTWDQVTRDVSYIGNTALRAGLATSDQGANNIIIFDEWRGLGIAGEAINRMNKDFAIAYDRVICLKDGEYEVTILIYINTDDHAGYRRLKVNGVIVFQMYSYSMNTNTVTISSSLDLKRGDYIQYDGTMQSTIGSYHITKL